VAQPRGLVVLKGAGAISPPVREFLSSELKIRVEVPALELLSDGVLLGGCMPGPKADIDIDILRAHAHLADTDPNVVLGPDSIGTLSFTSGSTGIPKGVKGRHYSLTHFFPWMGERFGLGSHSKFTMLSGIAHDPIQRDSQCIVAVLTNDLLIITILTSVYTIVLRCPVACTHG
jgi:L-aminoadipate-semialdehyde dehydrogenase